MTVNKAIEILDNEYNSYLVYKNAVANIDTGYIDDMLIALLTAIDALKEKCDIVK